MKHLFSLLEGQVCLRDKGLLAHKEGYMLALELSAVAFRDFYTQHVCQKRKLEKLSD